MVSLNRFVLCVSLALSLAGCPTPAPVPSAQVPPLADNVAPAPSAATDVQVAAAAVTASVVVAARDLADEMLPPRPPRSSERPVHPKVAAMLLALEVSNETYYNSRLQWPIYPGGASGPTWCIGYDGGTQSQAAIANDWFDHPSVERLKLTSGVRGAAAKAMLPSLRDIRTPFSVCVEVFETVSLPAYRGRASRLFRDGWEQLPWLVQDTLTSVGYNRGFSTLGPTRTEIRNIAYECVPARDLPCIETNIRAMTRVFVDPITKRGLAIAYNLRADLVHEAILEETQ